MRSIFTTLFMLLAVASGFSQITRFEIKERTNPSVKKEVLSGAQFINDISPELWSSLSFPPDEHSLLQLRRPHEFPLPPNYVFPQEKYKLIVDVAEVKITVSRQGKTLTATSSSDKLSDAQKKILATADLGTDVTVKLKFKYKDQNKDSYGERNKAIEGEAQITVLPASEAEFPGGYKKITEYFAQQVIQKSGDKDILQKVQRATIKFLVNENGKVIDAVLTRSSADAQIDRLLLEAIGNMPDWKPAVNTQGIKVKQFVSIPFNSGGC